MENHKPMESTRSILINRARLESNSRLTDVPEACNRSDDEEGEEA